jgi:hypothetical protein
MQLPAILQGDSRTRLVQGAVAGSILTIVIGFGFAGWQLTTNVERHAELRVDAALVAALTPICVDRFQHAADVKATLVALKATDTWQRDSFVEKGGWATFPGSAAPNSGVAEACAKILGDSK